MDGPFLPDTFAALADAEAIARFLLEDAGLFPHVAQARIGYLLQQPALMLHGQPCDAFITRATVQGPNRLLFAFLTSEGNGFWPIDFLVYVDAAAWQRRGWCPEAGPSGHGIEREALIYHELSHLKHALTGDGEPRYSDDGRPMLNLVRHSYEFFDHEITRYGPQTLGLEQVGADFVTGAQVEKDRRKRGRLKLA